MNSVSILGVRVSAITVQDVLDKIDEIIRSGNRALITHIHVMGLNIAYKEKWFRDFINQSELVYCDGIGVKLGAWILGMSLPERFTLADWIDQFAEFSQEKGFSWFFLGNLPGSGDEVARTLVDEYPRLRILGVSHGYFNKDRTHPEYVRIITEINRVNPDILFVGLGMPDQEEWIRNNWGKLNVKIAITCGGLFDVLIGKNPRGPSWRNRYYLESAARLIKSPKRYWKRYLIGNPLFLYRVLKQRITGIETGQ